MAEFADVEERLSVEEPGSGPGPEAEIEQQDEFIDETALEEVEAEELAGADVTAAETIQLTGQEIVTDSFGDLILPAEQAEQLQQAWALVINMSGNRDALADLIYSAFFGASASLEHLFVTPRAVAAFRFFVGINTFVANSGDPGRLRNFVETLGFGHMYLDITVPRVNIIRDAFVDLLVVELGSKLTSAAATGCVSLLNYIGGAQIYIKATYHERMQILEESWRLANDDAKNAERMASASMEDGRKKEEQNSETGSNGGTSGHGNGKQGDGIQNIPTTFKEMFQFNAAVMGFGQNLWMNEVLDLFNNIMANFANVGRVQEECYVLTIRISKVATGKVNLPEFKSCMLASLRSLLPKEWSTAHELAWTWSWERVETLLLENMGKTQKWEKSLVALLESVDEATGYQLRQDIYARFFTSTPAGEAYFKQNVTYLHLLVTKVLGLCMMMYKDPVYCVDDISGIGLRHVGYGIPTELFQPFIVVICGVVRDLGVDEVSLKAFTWVLNLIGQMQTRTITEGSTIVMKAININSPKAVAAAINCAARGVRAGWMLLITVGTRDISPFLWSVQSGAIEAGLAMLQDLLTIRADRDKYYYEFDYLFKRHPDLVNICLQDAPALVVPLLDGLIWRSRLTDNGYRRVNYYMKYLLIDPEGKFAKNIEWVVKSNDPKLMVHPMLVLLGDVVWSRVAMRSFVYRKTWSVVTLIMFVLSQSIIRGLLETDPEDEGLRYTIFAFRGFIYIFSMGQMIFWHFSKLVSSFRRGDVVKLGSCSIPTYLTNWQESFNLLLMVVLMSMLGTEPILHCLGADDVDLFSPYCDEIKDFSGVYYTLNMVAMILYYVLLFDLAVFNNRVSAYVLVCGRMLTELALFLLAMFAVLVTLSSALSCLQQEDEAFQNIGAGMRSLWEMLLRMFSTDHYKTLHDIPVVLAGVYVYLVVTAVFLFNLLIAQLCCSYDAIYADMVGYARLKRCRIIVETMPAVTPKRWNLFKESLGLDSRIEFNEGDIGVAGGFQVMEPANAHPTTVDYIKRVGGTTSPLAQWPEEEGDVEDDKFGKLEALVKKAMDTMTANKNQKRKKGAGGSSGMGGSGVADGSGAAEGSGVGSGMGDEAVEE